MKTKKYDRKLKLNKETISELSKKDMNGAYGGQETMAGPRCYTVASCIPDNSNVVICQ